MRLDENEQIDIKQVAKKLANGKNTNSEVVKPTIQEAPRVINLIVPDSLHTRFKTLCLLNKSDMRTIGLQLIKDYIDSHPEPFR